MSVPHEFGARVVVEVRRLGLIRAEWEWPGYVGIWAEDLTRPGLAWACGTANGDWACDLQDDGRHVETRETGVSGECEDPAIVAAGIVRALDGSRRVREFRRIFWVYDEGGHGTPARDVLVTRHCAVALSWAALCGLVVPWALRHGCEVERLDESRPFGARVLRVFPPDESAPTLEWIEPREVRR